MRSVRRAVSVGAIALTLAAAACTSDNDNTPSQQAPEPSTGSPKSEPVQVEDATATGVDAAMLEPVGTSPARVDTMTEIGPLSMTPDGLVVISVTRSNPRHPLRLIRADVALMDPESGDRKVISTPAQSKGIQVSGAVATRHWIAWTATTTTSLSEDPWTLYSYDRNTGRTHELAEAPTLPDGGAPMTSDFSAPSIAGDRVYLTGASKTQRGRATHTSVYSVALNGSGGLREDFPDELHPAASGDKILTARPGPGKTVQLVEHEAERSKATVVVERAGIEGHTLAGDAIAWAEQTRGRHTLYLKTDMNEPRAVVEAPRRMSQLLMTDKYIQFKARNSTYWYNRQTDKLLRLDRRDVFVPDRGSGDFIVWKTYSPQYGKPGGKIVVATLNQK